jgi:hypothetical protein
MIVVLPTLRKMPFSKHEFCTELTTEVCCHEQNITIYFQIISKKGIPIIRNKIIYRHPSLTAVNWFQKNKSTK